MMPAPARQKLMLSLAIDTSSHVCAAAVHDTRRDIVLAQASEELERGHAERLMDVVNGVLVAAKISYGGIERIIVTTGPGSFTGVRVGLAAARGMALGLGIEICGVSTLETAHWHAVNLGAGAETPLLVVMDARRDEAYCQIFGINGGKKAPFVAKYPEIAAMLEANVAWQLCGSGAVRVNNIGGGGFAILHDLAIAPIAAISRFGASLTCDNHRPEPLYLRAPDAKPQPGYALQRA